MAKYQVLYNPTAQSGAGSKVPEEVKALLPNDELVITDSTKIGDLQKFCDGLAPEDRLLVCGGDGTLNYLINHVDTDALKQEVWYLARGTGNDFLHDIGGSADSPVEISRYLKALPTVTVKGKTYKFLNGVGYGIDGYCCEVGDQLRAKSDKPVNYTSIAIKGILFHFKARDAKVFIDGVEHDFHKAWLAPAMKGRFYGGGMNCTPAQDRTKPGTLSCCVFYGKGPLKTLMAFPSIFKGEHIKHTDMVTILSGSTIKVQFASPCALQIDGETILDVSEYEARA